MEPNIAPRARPISRAWMVTFTDLVSLLLTFFVMLFSMSNVKMGTWEKMIDALSLTSKPSESTALEAATTRYNISTTFKKRAINLDYLAAVLGEAMAGNPLTRESRVIRQTDRLVIMLPGDDWFEPDRAALTVDGRQALFHLGGVLRNVGNEIGINGYAGSGRSVAAEFASGWELSLARAVTVGNALREAGYADGLALYGYSTSRLSGLEGLSKAQRRALERRVDIVIKPNIVGD